MKRDFSTAVTGWLFVLGAPMLWLGWVLLPRHIGTFFRPDDFSAPMRGVLGHAGVGAVPETHASSGLEDFEVQRLGLVVAVLVPVQEDQAGHGSERVRVVVPEHVSLALP